MPNASNSSNASDTFAEDSETPLTKTAWWLVRHGPVINPGNLIYGKADREIQTDNPGLYIPLAAALPHEAVYLTSSRGRTVKTLEAVAQAGGFPTPAFTQDSAFDEQNFGEWEGLTWDELYANGRSHTFWLAPAHERPPGGESFEDVMARVAGGLKAQTAEHAGQNIVLFAHGGTIRAALAHALGLDGETALQFSIDNCSLTRLTHLTLPEGGESWHVAHVNLAPTRPTGFCPSP